MGLYGRLSARWHRRRLRLAFERGRREAALQAGLAADPGTVAVVRSNDPADVEGYVHVASILASPEWKEFTAARARAAAAPRCGNGYLSFGTIYRCSEPLDHTGPHVDRANGFLYWCANCHNPLDDIDTRSCSCSHCGVEWAT